MKNYWFIDVFTSILASILGTIAACILMAWIVVAGTIFLVEHLPSLTWLWKWLALYVAGCFIWSLPYSFAELINSLRKII